jgi:hypothetical protein
VKGTLVVVLGLAICSLGCGHHSAEEDGHEGHGSHEESASVTLALELNDGEKWPVDDHTRAVAQRLAKLVTASEHLQTVDDARLLSTRLDEELGVLVKGCTMTGSAHDQLHVFLVALFPKVAELKEGDDVAKLQTVRDDIDGLLVAYAAHFD